MIRQKSFENTNPTLFLVATPIVNLSEFSPRAIETLKSVSLIACEDTRTSRTLLEKFDIKTRVVTYHNFNEEDSANGLLNILRNGDSIALISDAGYPLVSDPGFAIVHKASLEGFNVVTISGPSAGLHALVASGLETRHYMFYGFLNEKKSKAKKELENLKTFPYTMIFYESPHRILDTLKAAYEILGDRKACIARELSKKHEEYIRGTLAEFVTLDELKGEIVLMIEGYDDSQVEVDFKSIKEEIDNMIATGMSSKDAIKALAKAKNMSKNDIYREYHAQNEEN